MDVCLLWRLDPTMDWSHHHLVVFTLRHTITAGDDTLLGFQVVPVPPIPMTATSSQPLLFLPIPSPLPTQRKPRLLLRTP